jgi:hypothetical protein
MAVEWVLRLGKVCASIMVLLEILNCHGCEMEAEARMGLCLRR